MTLGNGEWGNGDSVAITNVAVTAPLIDIAYGDSSLQLVGGYSCGGSQPIGTRTRRAKRVSSTNTNCQ